MHLLSFCQSFVNQCQSPQVKRLKVFWKLRLWMLLKAEVWDSAISEMGLQWQRGSWGPFFQFISLLAEVTVAQNWHQTNKKKTLAKLEAGPELGSLAPGLHTASFQQCSSAPLQHTRNTEYQDLRLLTTPCCHVAKHVWQASVVSR